jgi:hypothetical protein
MFVILLLVGVIAFSTIGAGLIAPLAFVGLAFLEGHFITPTIIGRRLELNALAVFIALAFWTWLWGPMGGFLSSPLLIVGLILKEHLCRRSRRICRRTDRLHSGFSVGTSGNAGVCFVPNSESRELLMSSTEGETGMRNLTDKARNL